MSSPAEAPAVVAVVVTNDPGSYFDELLRSLGAQDYPNLSVLVIDAGSKTEIRERVSDILPDAFVRKLTKNPGFAAAANEALDAVEGASLLLICHDDVALDPSAVRFMVEEAFRANAGVVAPKVVEWDDPRKLITVGASADKVGMVLRTVEFGEIDQGQHDAVREVFVAPGGAMLVRADLFRILGGFDPDMRFTFEDVDFSWRAQIAGARIIAMPAARVRHGLKGSRGQRSVAAIGRRPNTRGFRDRLREIRASNSLRCVLKNYGRFNLLLVVPQMILLGIVESIYGIVTGRPVLATSFLKAWSHNLRELSSLRAARREVQSHRKVPDSVIRRQQVSVRQRIATYWRSQFAYEPSPESKAVLQSAKAPGAFRDAPKLAAIFWIVFAVFSVIAMRVVLFGTFPEVGLLRPFPHSGLSLLGWWSEPGKIGEFATTVLPNNIVAGASGLIGLFTPHAHVWFLRGVVAAGYVFGVIGVYRTSRLAGARGQIVATAVYTVSPAFALAMSRGSVSGLVGFALLPYMLRYIAIIFSVEPFGETYSRGFALRVALMLAVGVTLATDLLIVVVFVSLITTMLKVARRQSGEAVQGLLRLGGIVVVSAVLLLPAIASMALRSGWTPWLPQSSVLKLSWWSLLHLDVAPVHTGIYGWCFLIGGSLVLLIGREWRFRLAAFYWLIGVSLMLLIWLGSQGSLGGLRLDPALGVVVFSIALATSAGLGVTAFYADLPQFKFGFRQVASATAAIAIVATFLPFMGNMVSGKFEMPTLDEANLARPSYSDLTWMNDREVTSGEFRVLWVGTSDVLPVRAWPVSGLLRAGLSRGGVPSWETAFTQNPSASGKTLTNELATIYKSNGGAISDLLTKQHIKYVVVPYGQPGTPARVQSSAIKVALDQQLGLRTLSPYHEATVYENAAPLSKKIPSRTTPVHFYLLWAIQIFLWLIAVYYMRLLTPEQREEWS